jgi:hypothetical protein
MTRETIKFSQNLQIATVECFTHQNVFKIKENLKRTFCHSQHNFISESCSAVNVR